MIDAGFGKRGLDEQKADFKDENRPGYNMAAGLDEGMRAAWGRLQELETGSGPDKVRRDAIAEAKDQVAKEFARFKRSGNKGGIF